VVIQRLYGHVATTLDVIGHLERGRAQAATRVSVPGR
jgi:hypothetical protein